MFNKPRSDLFSSIQQLGFSPGLSLCVDAGDDFSYAGAGQNFIDRAGQTPNFFLGFDGTVTTSDPAFNGSAGRRSDGEYFSNDGGDYFTMSSAHPSWSINLHKSGSKHQLCTWYYYPATASDSIFGETQNDTAKIGVDCIMTAAGKFGPRIRNGVTNLTMDSIALVPTARWSFLAYAFDMAAGTVRISINGVQELTTGLSYPSPSAAGPSHWLQLWSRGNQGNPGQNLSRFGSLAMWGTRYLSADEEQALFMATRGKYGV